ncbi:MAG TPA: ANTAR domain-containing protein [Streptosporangiaceae bacterium]
MSSGSELAQETASLLSLANASQPRSLNQLVTLATRQVRACSGASAGLWRGQEPLMLVASHPDLPELIDAQLRAGRGPVLDALADGQPVGCPDALTETRWPEYTTAALRLGVRCSMTLASRHEHQAVTLSLFSARPRMLESSQLDLAELLIVYGRTVVGNAADYGDAQRTALQLQAAAESRAVVDQARGMLMQALGCDADEAMRWLRRASQQRNVRVADIAARVLAAGTVDQRKL